MHVSMRYRAASVPCADGQQVLLVGFLWTTTIRLGLCGAFFVALATPVSATPVTTWTTSVEHSSIYSIHQQGS